MNSQHKTTGPIEINLPTLSTGAFWSDGCIYDGNDTAMTPPGVYIAREDVPEGVEIIDNVATKSPEIFAHRFDQYNPDSPEISELNDCLQLAVSRADAALSMIQSQFATGDSRLNDALIFDALEAVSMQIRDIGEIVLHFAEAEKSPT